jgi:hypothetical protein
MRVHLNHVLSGWLFLFPTFRLSLAAPALDEAMDKPRASSCNTAANRACWTTGFNITTDYETSTPTTGVTRKVGTVLSALLTDLVVTY